MGVASNGSGEGAEDEEMEQLVTGAIKKLRLFNKAFPSVEARAVVEKLDSLRGARRTHLPSILVYVSRNGPQPNRLSSHMKMGRVNELSANTYDDAVALVRISPTPGVEAGRWGTTPIDVLLRDDSGNLADNKGQGSSRGRALPGRSGGFSCRYKGHWCGSLAINPQQPQQWRQATQLSLYTFVISHRDVARYYRDAHPDVFGILRFDIGIRKSMGDVEKSIALSPERAALSQ